MVMKMVRNVDPSLLRAFLAVAELGGMTAAASQLHLTQAAVSQQIKRLEELFGTQLFERGKRGLARTSAADRLLAKARAMLSLNDEIYQMMTRPEFEGRVRLGIPHDVVQTFMPDVLRRFDRAWPRVQVSLACSTTPVLLERLKAGDIDLAMTTEAVTPRGAERLLRDELVWVGAVDGAAYERRPLPISLGDERCAFKPVIVDALGKAGHDWRSVLEAGSMEAMSAAIRADLAIGAMLRTTLPRDLTVLGDGQALPPLPPFYLNLYVPAATADEVALELARHIKDSIGRVERMAA